MTATALHDLTAPLFKKHTSAKPDGFLFALNSNACLCDLSVISRAHAELIITGHLTRWLLERQPSSNNRKQNLTLLVSEHGTCAVRYCVNGQFGPTILHAIVNAAEAVPCN